MAFPVTGLLDSFDRANSASLGASWSNLTNPSANAGFGISSNLALGQSATGFNESWYNIATYGPNSELYMDIPTRGASYYFYPKICIASPGTTGVDSYTVLWDAATGLKIFRTDNNVDTQLGATIALTLVDGDSIGIEKTGSTLNVYRKTGGVWSLSGSRTDATYSTGYIGMSAKTSNGRINNFSGGRIPTAASQSVTATKALSAFILKRPSILKSVVAATVEFISNRPAVTGAVSQATSVFTTNVVNRLLDLANLILSSAIINKTINRVVTATVANTTSLLKKAATTAVATVTASSNILKIPFKSFSSSAPSTSIITRKPLITKGANVVGGISGFVRSPLKLNSATLASLTTINLARIKSLLISATQTAVPTLTRSARKIVPVSLVTSASTILNKIKLLALTATPISGNSTIRKSPTKVSSAQVGSAVSLQRVVTRVIKATPGVLASLVTQGSQIVVLTLTAATSAGTSILKLPGKVVSTASVLVPSTTKRVNKSIAAVQVSSAVVSKKVIKAFGAGLTATASIASSKTRTLALIASNALAGVLTRQPGRVVSATQSCVGFVSKLVQKGVATSQALAGSVSSTKVKLLLISVSTSLAASLSNRAGKIIGATQLNTVSLARFARSNLAATGAATASLFKRPATTLLTANTALMAGLTTIKVKLLTLAANVSSVALLSKRVSRAVNSSGSIVPTLVKQPLKNLYNSAVSGVSITKQPQIIKTVSNALAAGLTLVKVKLLTLAATVTPIATLTKRLTRAITSTTGLAGAIAKQPGRVLTAGVTLVASLSTLKNKLLTLAASVGSAALITKLPAKALAVGQTAAGNMTRQVRKYLSWTVEVNSSLSKLIGKSFSTNSVLSAIVTAIKLIPGAVTQSAIVATVKLGNQSVTAAVRMGDQVVAASVQMGNQAITGTAGMGKKAIGFIVKTDFIKAVVGRMKLG